MPVGDFFWWLLFAYPLLGLATLLIVAHWLGVRLDGRVVGSAALIALLWPLVAVVLGLCWLFVVWAAWREGETRNGKKVER
jgi:Na+/H+-dicarboxylate symporter